MILALFLSALAADPKTPPVPPTPSAASFHQLAEKVGLTSEQERSIQDLVYKSNLAKVDIKARRERAELMLRQLVSQSNLDEKAIRTALDELNAAEADMRRNRIELVLAIRKLINAEQWATLQDLWMSKEDGPPDAPRPPPPPQ